MLTEGKHVKLNTIAVLFVQQEAEKQLMRRNTKICFKIASELIMKCESKVISSLLEFRLISFKCRP